MTELMRTFARTSVRQALRFSVEKPATKKIEIASSILPNVTRRAVGKWEVPTLDAAGSEGPRTSRLSVTDLVTKMEFLVGTGSDLCVLPRTCVKGRTEKSAYEMFAANGTTISIKALRLGLGL